MTAAPSLSHGAERNDYTTLPGLSQGNRGGPYRRKRLLAYRPSHVGDYGMQVAKKMGGFNRFTSNMSITPSGLMSSRTL